MRKLSALFSFAALALSFNSPRSDLGEHASTAEVPRLFRVAQRDAAAPAQNRCRGDEPGNAGAEPEHHFDSNVQQFVHQRGSATIV